MKAHKHAHGGLPRYLRDIQEEIEGYARNYGLDFFPQIFEILTYEQMNMVAAYGGFPTRYPHWRFGMEYQQLKKSYTYGLSKIYEMVINNDPCYAYLLEGNSLVDQKMVMAHVCAHNDFFKNNRWFDHTNRSMIDEMANHGTRVRRFVDSFGIESVEEFIDVCLSIDNLIDVHSAYIKRRAEVVASDSDEVQVAEPTKFEGKSYMQPYINPPDLMRAEKERLTEEANQAERRFPREPERDIMVFLL